MGAPSRRNNNIRPASDTREVLSATETYRTPESAYLPLLDYEPSWFEGSGYDPSAGDGRMLREVRRRGNLGPHYLNDIRASELVAMSRVGAATIEDYLAIDYPPHADFFLTNPPFTKAVDFVRKARTHIRGPICILQSVAWQGTQKRSEWLRHSGLAYVLNLKRRPKWEVDVGSAANNIWDFAWFVFFPGHEELPQMDWIG